MNSVKLGEGYAVGKHPLLAQMLVTLELSEMVVVAGSSWTAYAYRHGTWGMPYDYILMTVLGVMVYGLFAFLTRMYRPAALMRPAFELPKVYLHLLGSLGSMVLLLFLLKISSAFSRTWLIAWIVLAIVGITLIRLVLAWLAYRIRQKGVWALRIAVLGTDDKAMEIARLLGDGSRMDARLVGLYAVDEDNVPNDLRNLELYRGNVAALLRDGRKEVFDTVILTHDLDHGSGSHGLLVKLHRLAVDVYYCLPLALFGRVVTKGRQRIPDIPLQLLYRQPLDAQSLLAKRGLDVVCSTLLLLVLAPLMLVIALAIKVSSRGPVLFSQPREGFNGDAFNMLKFRSMRVGGHATLDADGKEKQASPNDDRITLVGRFLRRTSLDELPQLLNVLKGDMSLVGPRPHVPSHNSHYENLIDRYASRHKMRPGITGWAQLNGWRGETDTLDKMAKRVEHDIWYTENWSLALDLRIILMTPLMVLFQKKAY